MFRKQENIACCYLWCVVNPIDDTLHALLIVGHHLVGHTVGIHDLWPSQLVLGGVDLLAQQFVESREACEDHGALLHLNHTLAQTIEVRTNTNRSVIDKNIESKWYKV